MGISPVFAGRATFFLAALIGTVSGILIAPITTMYFDSGFMVSLKASSAPSSADWSAIRWPPRARCWWA